MGRTTGQISRVGIVDLQEVNKTPLQMRIFLQMRRPRIMGRRASVPPAEVLYAEDVTQDRLLVWLWTLPAAKGLMSIHSVPTRLDLGTLLGEAVAVARSKTYQPGWQMDGSSVAA